MDNSNLRAPGPIDSIPMIEELDRRLIRLLRGLEKGDWARVAAGTWSIRDVAAHLLDGNLRRLSLCRDGMFDAGSNPGDFPSILALLNQMNADWITAAQRLSPRVIMDLLETTNVEVTEYFASLDPAERAPFPVSWAGQTESPVWLDLAREFTEKWHHQQQVRDAVHSPALTDVEFVVPLLKTLILGVPRAYRETPAEDGATIGVSVTDMPTLGWVLARDRGSWHLFETSGPVKSDASVDLDSDMLWKLLFRSLSADEIRARATVSGHPSLTDPFFTTTSVMA